MKKKIAFSERTILCHLLLLLLTVFVNDIFFCYYFYVDLFDVFIFILSTFVFLCFKLENSFQCLFVSCSYFMSLINVFFSVFCCQILYDTIHGLYQVTFSSSFFIFLLLLTVFVNDIFFCYYFYVDLFDVFIFILSTFVFLCFKLENSFQCLFVSCSYFMSLINVFFSVFCCQILYDTIHGLYQVTFSSSFFIFLHYI